MHADDAAVNVNLWITDNDANLDPDSGGMIVYKEKAPEVAPIITIPAVCS